MSRIKRLSGAILPIWALCALVAVGSLQSGCAAWCGVPGFGAFCSSPSNHTSVVPSDSGTPVCTKDGKVDGNGNPCHPNETDGGVASCDTSTPAPDQGTEASPDAGVPAEDVGQASTPDTNTPNDDTGTVPPADAGTTQPPDCTKLQIPNSWFCESWGCEVFWTLVDGECKSTCQDTFNPARTLEQIKSVCDFGDPA